MKFIYMDESGVKNQSDVFVICGLMVDAYKLRKKTEDFDSMLHNFLALHPSVAKELKTSRIINGRGGWSNVESDVRKAFLIDVCELAVSNGGKIYGLAIEHDRFMSACKSPIQPPFGKSYWLAGAIFTLCLVQKKMQNVLGGKGITVAIMDDNKREMSDLSNAIYESDPWFDELYQMPNKKGKSGSWRPRKDSDRFDQIVNTVFAIKSNHSSLVQVADLISYVYRRSLELRSTDEEWGGEKVYYQTLLDIIEPRRARLGRCPDSECVRFFRQIKHPDWNL